MITPIDSLDYSPVTVNWEYYVHNILHHKRDEVIVDYSMLVYIIDNQNYNIEKRINNRI